MIAAASRTARAVMAASGMNVSLLDPASLTARSHSLMVVSVVPDACRPSGKTAFVGEGFAIGAGLGEADAEATRGGYGLRR